MTLIVLCGGNTVDAATLVLEKVVAEVGAYGTNRAIKAGDQEFRSSYLDGAGSVNGLTVEIFNTDPLFGVSYKVDPLDGRLKFSHSTTASLAVDGVQAQVTDFWGDARLYFEFRYSGEEIGVPSRAISMLTHFAEGISGEMSGSFIGSSSVFFLRTVVKDAIGSVESVIGNQIRTVSNYGPPSSEIVRLVSQSGGGPDNVGESDIYVLDTGDPDYRDFNVNLYSPQLTLYDGSYLGIEFTASFFTSVRASFHYSPEYFYDLLGQNTSLLRFELPEGVFVDTQEFFRSDPTWIERQPVAAVPISSSLSMMVLWCVCLYGATQFGRRSRLRATQTSNGVRGRTFGFGKLEMLIPLS